MKSSLTTEQRLYQLPVPVIAITGNVASGKSTLMNYLKLQGKAVLVLDGLIQLLYQRPQTLEQLIRWAPELITITENKSSIDREGLRQKFFTDQEFKQQWEQYLQQQLPELVRQQRLEQFPGATHLYIEIPLLFEKQLQSKVDFIVLVTTDSARQLQWFKERPQALELEQVRAHQIPAENYQSQCHFIVPNLGSTEDLKQQTQQLIQQVDHLFPGVRS